MKSQLIISSITQGNGKTIFSLALARCLQNRDLKPQLYKCGPDVADTLLHAMVCNGGSYNLDTWLASRNHIKYVYNTHSETSDVSIIEGNGGLFDGYKRMQGSTAEMAHLLNLPVVLVVSAKQVTYSLLPVLYGFKNLRKNIRIAGVVFNNVQSASQFNFLKDICREAGLDCFGYLPFDENLKFASRQVILTNDNKRHWTNIIELAMKLVQQYVDIPSLLNAVTSVFPCPYTLPYSSEIEQDLTLGYRRRLNVAVANDAAFCLPYQENIDRLKRTGNITYFSPVNSKNIPESDLIYFPDGYVELFARVLHRRRPMLNQLKDFVEAGGKVLAEGSGIFPLVNSVITRSGGTSYQMAGVLPLDITLADARMQTGLRKIDQAECSIRGYESRIFSVLPHDSISPLPVLNQRSLEADSYVYRYKNVFASLSRFFWGENDFPFSND